MEDVNGGYCKWSTFVMFAFFLTQLQYHIIVKSIMVGKQQQLFENIKVDNNDYIIQTISSSDNM